MLKFFTFFSLTFLSYLTYAQTSQDSLHLIQLSGVVIEEEELTPMPYTTIYDKTGKRGVIADGYGYFSMVVQPGDTLFFSFFGYKNNSYIVPDTLTDNRYSIIHMMHPDTMNLPEVTVYPWPSREDFARAFVNMKPYDDALRRAQRELSGESLAFAAARLQNDAGLSYAYARNQQYTRLYTRNQMPSGFSPYALLKLIEDWKAGNLKRQ